MVRLYDFQWPHQRVIQSTRMAGLGYLWHTPIQIDLAYEPLHRSVRIT